MEHQRAVKGMCVFGCGPCEGTATMFIQNNHDITEGREYQVMLLAAHFQQTNVQ
jgi:hypothetical protein